jgi:SAM-dependent methyltransferase
MSARRVVTARDARVALPDRYRARWRDRFESAMLARLREGVTVLDIGSGRNPSLAPPNRPAATRWIGLDVSRPELVQAPPGSYDEVVVGDLATPLAGLAGTIDLAVSWQVLEHVRPLDRAVANVHGYLRPGGEFVCQFSGAWSPFAIVNRLLPDRLGSALVGRTMRRRDSAHPVFPAHYDRCYASALERVFADWSSVTIEPLFRGATYFHFSAALQRAYLAYEEMAIRRDLTNLATHYFVVAVR